MVRAVVEALASTPFDLPALLRYFEVWTLRLAGFLPDLRLCADCSKRLGEDSPVYFNAELKARCGQCSNRLGREFSQAAYKQLRAAQRLSPSEFAASVRSTGTETLNELAELSQGLIGRILERQPRSRANLN
jgi:recombinational DNA repair protein (RecF pathway)